MKLAGPDGASLRYREEKPKPPLPSFPLTVEIICGSMVTGINQIVFIAAGGLHDDAEIQIHPDRMITGTQRFEVDRRMPGVFKE